MPRHTDPALTRLSHGTLMTLPRGAGHGIAVFAGLLWVTEEGDLKDHFLGAGECLSLRGDDRVVVQAFGAAQLLVYETEAAAAA